MDEHDTQTAHARGAPEATDDAATREVAAWVSHLFRTLKTCRLYDAANPTVVRFRETLSGDLLALVERLGAVKLEVTPRELVYEGHPVHAGRTREDALAAVFHRDGIRAITFLPGLEAREVESLLDRLLLVTGPNPGDDDLVTLLWDANLSSIVVTSVPIEGDADGGSGEGDEEGAALPWPGAASGGPAAAPAPAPPAAAGGNDRPGRSDDWEVLERAGDLAALFAALERAAEAEVERFQREMAAEAAVPLVAGTVEVLAEALSTETTPEDRREIAAFLPRTLREALAAGEWRTGRQVLRLLRLAGESWSAEAFFQGLGAGSAMVTRKVVRALDGQDEAGIEAFLALGEELGDPAADWLMEVLAESQQRRVRQPLARVVAGLVREHPERMLPWLGDERWYVVRNAVHILSWIGGDDVAGYLRAPSGHPEPRVRREVVAALAGASHDVARPVLLAMLPEAGGRLFATLVQQLASEEHPEVVQRLLELLRDERFTARPEDERRAVYLALATQGDAVVPALEDELHRGGRFARGLEPHWISVARCLARIATPAARETLGRGARAPRPGVRRACEQALAAMEARDGR